MPSLFSYSTAPQPIKPAAKYRNKDAAAAAGDVSLSLMSDPRVIRGTTTAPLFSTRPGAANNLLGGEGTEKEGFRNTKKSSSSKDATSRGTYNFEFKKYSNDDLDLSLYLTEKNDKANRYPPKIVETQTDEFVPRPPSPEYVPRKTGIDSYTQVEDANELFDFDVEVTPMLDVIVAKTLEQALFEMNAENELFELNKTMVQFIANADEEEEWVRQKEAETRKESYQKQGDLARMRERAHELLQTNIKVAGVQMMEQIMPSVMEQLTQDLYKSGEWNDVLRMTAQQAVAELTESCCLAADGVLAAEDIIDELLHSATETFGAMPEYVPRVRSLKLTIILRKESGGESDGAVEGEGGEGTELVIEGLDDQSAPPAPEGEGAPTDGDDAGASASAGAGADAGAGEGEREGADEPTMEPGAVKIGPILIDATDDIISAQAKLNIGLQEQGKGDAKVDLYPYFVAALRGRDFPRDATLMNFDLPKTLNIVI